MTTAETKAKARQITPETYKRVAENLNNLRVVVGDYFQDGYKTVKKPVKQDFESEYDSVESTRELRVEKLIVHHEYLQGIQDKNHDIVLIKLTDESYNEIKKLDRKLVRAACLPSRMVDSTV